MLVKTLKYGTIAVVGLTLIGGITFGKDLLSYMRSSAKSVRTAVKDSVPIEFELQRARDMVEDIIPQLHANIRLIAQEEVEISALEHDIEATAQKVADERGRIARVRQRLRTTEASYRFGDRYYSREQMTHDLAARFDRFKEAEIIHDSKKRLLETRTASLQAAMEMLQRTRHQKAQLEQQIEALAGQHRLVQAAATNSQIVVDGSKLAAATKLITQIRKRLNVAERVLAHEANFVQSVPVDMIDQDDLLAEIDEYLGQREATSLSEAAPQDAPLPAAPLGG